MGFLTSLELKETDTEGVWILSNPLIYHSEFLDCNVGVPRGFVTDLASVPRLPFIYTLWGDRAHHESVIHDYLYRSNSIPTVEKKQADLAFLEAMKIRGKPMRIRYPMYWGVRLCGFKAYHKKKV